MRDFEQQTFSGSLVKNTWIRGIFENILFAFIFLVCFSAIDFFYQFHAHQPLWKHETDIGLRWLFAYGLILSAIFSNRLLCSCLTFIAAFLCIQLVYSGYFGTPLSAMDITLFFENSVETIEDLSSITNLAVIPFSICVLAFVIIATAGRRLNQRLRFRWMWLVLLLIFVQPPLYTMHMVKQLKMIGTGSNISVGEFPNVSENLWITSNKTIIYFLTNTLPHQLSGKHDRKNVLPPLVIEKPRPDVNVIFIMGESLTDGHMSSYGYARTTTPFLDTLKNNPNVVFKRGISAGVMTDISLPMIFNMVPQPDATMQIASTNRNLFKLAKANGFETHFISTQGHYALKLIKGYLFPGYIDHYGDAMLFGADQNSDALDFNLLKYFQSVDFEKPQFVVLHQKGSHMPYEARYPLKFEIFPNSTDISFHDQQVNSYDNSVRYTDAFLAELIKIIETKTTRPTYVIFTSDHGESLGENGIYGHTRIKENIQHHVPIIFMAFHGANLDFLKDKAQKDIAPDYMSHLEMSQAIASFLGYQLPFKSQQSQGYVVNGNSLSGAAGIDQISFDNTGKLVDHLQF